MLDKLRAVEQLAKLCGWNGPEKFEHGASKPARRVPCSPRSRRALEPTGRRTGEKGPA
jgi:hypothetical protein